MSRATSDVGALPSSARAAEAIAIWLTLDGVREGGVTEEKEPTLAAQRRNYRFGEKRGLSVAQISLKFGQLSGGPGEVRDGYIRVPSGGASRPPLAVDSA